MASDAGIALQAVTLAVLLHQRRMVSLASIDYREIARCFLAALAGGGAVGVLLGGISKLPVPLFHPLASANIRWLDLALLLIGTAVWGAVAKWVLERTGSALPRVAMNRLQLR